MTHKRRLLATVGTMIVLASGQAGANDAVTLKFSHPFPATHKQWVQAGQVLETAAKEGGMAVTFQPYPASQLGKEHTSLIGSGLAQAGIVAPSYEPDKLPGTSVAELPGIVSSSCEGTGKLWNIVKEGSILDELEYKPLGLIALYVNATPPYSVLTTSKEVTNLEGIAGLKIRAAGGAMDRTARRLNAVPISGTASEIYDSLTRGTIDGSMMSIEAVSALGLENVLQYAFDGVNIGGAVTVGVMNRRAWDALEDGGKDRLREAGLKAQRHFCEWYQAAVETEARNLSEQGKLKSTVASPEESARWNEALSHVAESWAADLDKAGRRGSDVLKAFLEASPEF